MKVVSADTLKVGDNIYIRRGNAEVGYKHLKHPILKIRKVRNFIKFNVKAEIGLLTAFTKQGVLTD